MEYALCLDCLLTRHDYDGRKRIWLAGRCVVQHERALELDERRVEIAYAPDTTSVMTYCGEDDAGPAEHPYLNSFGDSLADDNRT